MDFSDALRELKGGNLMTREAWVDTCQYIEYMPEEKDMVVTTCGGIPVHRSHVAFFWVRALAKGYSGFWHASNVDLLAEDWMILGPMQLREYERRGNEAYVKEFKRLEDVYIKSVTNESDE